MNIKDLNKIEFWAASFIYGCAVLMLISNGSSAYTEVPKEFKDAYIEYSYLSNYFLPELFRYSILYFSFLMLNFCCLPPLYRKVDIGFNTAILLATYLISGLVISITRTYTQTYLLSQYPDIDDAYTQIFFKGFTYSAWLVLLICIYVALKKLLIYFTDNKEDSTQHRMKLEIVFGMAFWFVGVLLWLAAGVGFDVIICWTMVVIAGIFTTIYSIYYIIPTVSSVVNPSRTFYGKITIIAFLTGIPVGLVGALIGSRGELFIIINLFHIPAQLAISAPLAWYIYRNRNATEQEIFTLKKELGKSDASLGFLKSQINPHFLFNALNTLYGTALQENAERTGEGIQKLGDMMRFMLQENMQDKISLSRDIDYLNNYIALQKLRTSLSVDIIISTEIEEDFSSLQIAPMLLIPFVENAFKHGISLQSPSHIKVTLQTKGHTLYFDVNNSIHLKADGDPEKLQSGIGLPNVKQRLELLYPKKHELIIRESAKEFFVHLTLNLA
ncbi:Histidine kinase [Pedobacter westerhofensis]|uniref:Histidine kinase n=1 Tax=Pedobacter westerhofensis TaxID=425512 RepID=A0A521DDJ0_9SPHI|nr:histidine kinase [Pedobacter westerhofensis]SMO69874.1 Histidine kinase [Pedobacter westerhofensis]